MNERQELTCRASETHVTHPRVPSEERCRKARPCALATEPQCVLKPRSTLGREGCATVFNEAGFTVERISSSAVWWTLVCREPPGLGSWVLLEGLGADRMSRPAEPAFAIPQVAHVLFQPICPSPASPELDRVVAALGGGDLWYAECEFACVSSHAVHYYRVAMANELDEIPNGQPVGVSWHPGQRFAERRKCGFSLGTTIGRRVSYGFLATSEQIKSQMDHIIDQARREGSYLDPADEISTDLLVRLFFSVCGGYDTPLLESNSEVYHD